MRAMMGGKALRYAHVIRPATWGKTILILVASGVAAPALAGDRHWNISSGPWAQAADWSPAGVPQPADNAIVDYFSGTPGRSNISTNVGAVTSATVSNGDTVAIDNQGTLLCGFNGFTVGQNNSAGTLSIINPNPIVFFNGGLTITGDLRAGVNSGSGTITQNAGTVTVVGVTELGYSNDPTSAFTAAGTYNLSGGILKANGGIDMGTGNLSQHTNAFLNLSGSGIIDTPELFVGVSTSSATVTQSGGQMNVGTIMVVGTSNGGGTYNMNGGSFTTPEVQMYAHSAINFRGGSMSCGAMYLTSAGGSVVLSPGRDKVLHAWGLSLGSGDSIDGMVDLNDNAMTVQNTARILYYIISAYNNGAWTGPGLTSSAARSAAPTAHKTGLGYDFGSLAPLVRYAYYGDANLDGRVDTLDFNALAAGFGSSSLPWTSGDFNYDFKVDTLDFNALAANFGQSLPEAGTEAAGASGLVPEPAAGALLSVIAAGSMRRRRLTRGRATRRG